MLLLSLIPIAGGSQTIITVAGTGVSGFSGDGNLATNAELNLPNSVAFDKNNNTIFVDGNNNRVRKISSSGIINTIAGTGTAGFSGDNGPATLAEISPISIATDTAGNIYFSESTHRIRKINTAGIISTIAGTGTGGYNGDGIAATAAQLFYPYLGAADNFGDLYFSDYDNHRVRKIDVRGIISTVAGNGTSGYSGDGGPATAAEIRNPVFMSMSASGDIYIPDNTGGRIRKVDAAGIITTIAGNGLVGNTGDAGAATVAKLNLPNSVTVDDTGNIYIASTGANVIRKVDRMGIISTIAGTGIAGYSGDGGPATAAELNRPNHIAFNKTGNLFIADMNNNRVRMIEYKPVKVNEPEFKQARVSVFPNPVCNEIHIQAKTKIEEIKILSNPGMLVYHAKCKSADITIDLSHLPPASYLLEIVDEQLQKTVEKIIKE